MGQRKIEEYELTDLNLTLWTCDECFDEAVTLGGNPAGWYEEWQPEHNRHQWLCRDCSSTKVYK